MLTPEEMNAIFDRLLAGQATEADIYALRLELQQGKYRIEAEQLNANEIHIGDRIYQGADAESLKDALRSILRERKKISRPKSERQFLSSMKDDVELRLQQSLHRSVPISLDKASQPEQVNPTWKKDVLIAEKAPETIASDEPLANILHRNDIKGKLLILGAPGSGKTTTTLELARELLNHAEEESDYPIPVLFNLSSWKNNGKTLFDWMIDDLKDRVQREVSEKWLKEQKLLPILDGLDEVKAEHQEACVEAINQQLLTGERSLACLVVCSRREEYSNYKTKLLLNGAICLRELTNEQIQSYLETVDYANLWQTISSDENLLMIVRSPLLLNITILAYQQSSFEHWQTLHSTEERIEYLLRAYIRQMLERPIRSNFYKKDRFPKSSRTRKWLIYLANQLQKESQTEFLIERMSPFWLTPEVSSSQKRRFRTTLVLSYITLSGIFLTWHRLLIGLPLLVLISIILTFNGFQSISYGNQSVGFINLVIIVSGLIFSVLLNGMMGCLIVLIVFGFGNDIKPFEKFGWSWNKAKAGFRAGWERILLNLFNRYPILFGMSFAAFYGLLFITVILVAGNLSVRFFLAVFSSPIWGIPLLGLVSGLGNALTEGLRGSEVRTKVIPNQSIWRSLKNGIYLGIPLCLISAIALAPFHNSFRYVVLNGWEGIGSIQKLVVKQEISIQVEVVMFILDLALYVGLIGFLFAGGEACVKHLSLRLIIYRQNCAPWNYARFLDYCTERRLLQRVGGRYKFIHRLLQEHFANQNNRA